MCDAMEGGETLKFFHEPEIAIEVTNSSSLKADSKLQNFTSKSHHTNEGEW
jgi:hypothetical protein